MTVCCANKSSGSESYFGQQVALVVSFAHAKHHLSVHQTKSAFERRRIFVCIIHYSLFIFDAFGGPFQLIVVSMLEYKVIVLLVDLCYNIYNQ